MSFGNDLNIKINAVPYELVCSDTMDIYYYILLYIIIIIIIIIIGTDPRRGGHALNKRNTILRQRGTQHRLTPVNPLQLITVCSLRPRYC